jgi:hypothetical protein
MNAAVAYFLNITGRTFGAHEQEAIKSGVQHKHFARLLGNMTTPAQLARIQQAIAPIVSA